MMSLNDPLPQIIALLRQMRDDSARLLPAGSDGAAREHLQQVIPVLDRLATDLASPPLTAELRDQAGELFRAIDLVVNESAVVVSDNAAAVQRDLVTRLRALVAMQTGTDAEQGAAITEIWRRSAELGAGLRAHIESGRPAPVAESPPADAAITTQSLTRYLRQRWTDAPAVEVQSVQRLNGGRSKITLFATLTGHPRIDQLALRQDVPNGMIDTVDGNTCVVDEYPLVLAAYAAGLPVPEPLWLEAQTTDLGPPFMMTRKLDGTAPGDWRGFHQPGDPQIRAAVGHLAEVLAGLHRLAHPSKTRQSAEQMMQREIDYRRRKWQQDALRDFPLIECALHRLREECRQGLGEPVFVHGDVLPHNLLFAEGRVSGLLDWEFAHAGDPAEDLAYCRAAVSAVMPWPEFMDRYRTAGGPSISERRLAVFGLYGLVRNSGLLASAGHLHAQGRIDDFATGAIAYAALPMMESLIGAQLNTLDAVNRH